MELQEVQELISQAQALAQNAQTNDNYVWVMVSAALVFSMQFGFMYLESGLAQAKHSINVAIKNLADFVVAVIVFWIVGFGLMFGDTIGGVIGGSNFFISVEHPWTAAFFVFQAVFVGTAATIDSGAVAGRARFSSYLILSALISGLIYPVFGHWAWGSLLNGSQAGWLEAMGFKDFAGSTVVHSVGGWTALVGIIILGPRLGKFNKDGTPNRIPPYSLPDAILGTLILFFGWFGFNCGSTLEASPEIAPIAMNTALAACFGAASSTFLSWTRNKDKRPEIEMIANGLLGGLVGITAGCAFVDSFSAMIIGLVSGVLVYFSVIFIERTLKLDDVVGAVAVHGVCGAWGTIAVGLFDVESGLFYGAGFSQLGIQTLGVVVCFVWTFVMGFLVIWFINTFFGGLRVSHEDEEIGLNIAEHGAKMSWYDTLTTVNDIAKTGNLDCRIEVEHGTEAGEVATACNIMLEEMQRTAHLAKRIAEGDLSESVTPKGDDDVLGHAIVSMVDSLRERKTVQRETIAAIAEIVRTGDLTKGVQVDEHSEMAEVADSFNALLEEIAEAAEVAKKVAQKDLTATITPKSERDTLNLAIASMLDSLRVAKQSREQTVETIQHIVRTGDLTQRVAVDNDPEMGAVAEAFNQFIDEVLKSARLAQQVAEGDLSQSVPVKSQDDIQALAVNKMIDSLKHLLRRIDDVAEALSSSISDLDMSTQDLEGANTDLTNSILSAAKIVDNSIQAVQAMNEQAMEGAAAKESTAKNMQQVSNSLVLLAEAINSFDENTKSIADFTVTIQNIADQTNLLALNATIQAASAGEAGKGFAVVAGEIKNLALESAGASEQVNKLVESIKLETSSAMESAQKNRDTTVDISDSMVRVLSGAFDGIKHAVGDVTSKMETIFTATEEQKYVIERNAHVVSNITGISRVLKEKATTLSDTLRVFKLSGSNAEG